MTEEPLSRRTFASQALKAVVSGSLLTLVLEGCSSSSSDSLTGPMIDGTGSSSTLTLDLNDAKYAALKPVGGAVKVAVSGWMPVIIIQASEGTYLAFSSECPHQGCEVDLPNRNGILNCLCHGSQFDLQGHRLRGPTPRGLAAFAVTLQEGKLSVAV